MGDREQARQIDGLPPGQAWPEGRQEKQQGKQRCMGVEPTRDRAQRPPDRFEDGEAHRDPYTSVIRCWQAEKCQ